MRYNNTKLILDNFRVVLKEYSVDLQDVVRSAILDDVDIGSYIKICKGDPYKLDQIRLAKKQGILSQVILMMDGDVIYQIRYLYRMGISIPKIESAINNLKSSEHISYALNWLKDSIDLDGIDVSLIPRDLLSCFDEGLRYGLDMKGYVTGVQYRKDLLTSCITIQKTGHSVSKLLEGDWKQEVLKLLEVIAKSKDASLYDRVIMSISPLTSEERVSSLIEVGKKTNLNLQTINAISSGVYVYEDACLPIICRAYISNVNMKELLECRSAREMEDYLASTELNKRRTVSGRLSKQSTNW